VSLFAIALRAQKPTQKNLPIIKALAVSLVQQLI
jgi:hypothetical protein